MLQDCTHYMYVFMDGWMDGWMDRWMDSRLTDGSFPREQTPDMSPFMSLKVI
jgi:hypothetical protein